MFDNADQLVQGHTLSFTSQTELDDLFKLFLDPSSNVTFVVGAGFSMNAGLPSWDQLLANMFPILGKPAFADMAKSDWDPPSRRAEYLIRMAEEATPGDPRSIVRDALYRGIRAPVPGPLMESLASVAAALGSRARILTTNFDHLIEDSLAQIPVPVKAFALEDYADWESAASGPGDVLHLHGLLEPNVTPATEIVLTESHFLARGPRVREVITKRLQSDVVIFVGVSLTDPNLVGPLFDLASGRVIPSTKHAPFLLIVPDEAEPNHGSPDFRDQMDFFLAKLRSISKSLAIRPVILKSHSQVAQLLWELNLSARDTTAYKIGRGRKLTSTYGSRFTATLGTCYSKLGAPRNSDFIKQPESILLANQLQDALSAAHPLGKHASREAAKFSKAGEAPEELALFLWLRSRKHGAEHAPYSLRLVATSSYVSRHPWTMAKPQRISRTSKYAAVKAVFGGIATLQNLPDEPTRSVWKGALAVPIRLRDGLHLYTVGAITLNSTRYMIRESIPPEIKDPGSQLSFIAKVTSGPLFSDLIVELERAATTLLT